MVNGRLASPGWVAQVLLLWRKRKQGSPPTAAGGAAVTVTVYTIVQETRRTGIDLVGREDVCFSRELSSSEPKARQKMGPINTT